MAEWAFSYSSRVFEKSAPNSTNCQNFLQINYRQHTTKTNVPKIVSRFYNVSNFFMFRRKMK